MTIIHADVLKWLRGEQWQVHHGYFRRAHAVFADPPYALQFMNATWDKHATPQHYQEWVTEWATLLLDFVYPGAVLAMFGGTRTYHRLAAGLEDAGWEVFDCMMYVYGSGFPKAADIGKLIDKVKDWTLVERLNEEITRARTEANLSLRDIGQRVQAFSEGQYGKWYHRGGHMFFETGRSLPSRPEWEFLRLCLPIRDEFVKVYDEAEREVVGTSRNQIHLANLGDAGYKAEWDVTLPATDAAKQWDGYKTALKPAYEPIVLARAPRDGLTYAQLAQIYGTAALNVDAGRIGYGGLSLEEVRKQAGSPTKSGAHRASGYAMGEREMDFDAKGRYPANLILDDVAAALLDAQSGELTSGTKSPEHNRNVPRLGNGGVYGNDAGTRPPREWQGDSGGASRFFQTVKHPPLCVLCNSFSGVESVIIPPVDEGENECETASGATRNLSPAENQTASALFSAAGTQLPAPEGSKASSNGHVNTAASSSKNTPPTGTPTAHKSAPDLTIASLVPLVRSAATLCEKCITVIAQSLVQIRQDQSPDTRAIRDCMPEQHAQILIQNLALYAESLASIATTPTTASLKLLFGSVQHAIDEHTAEQTSKSAPSRFRYASKAPSWEREAGLDNLPSSTVTDGRETPIDNPYQRGETTRRNIHPTVKNISLCEYIARLLLPPVLDAPRRILVPFAGVGSEQIGATLAGWDEVIGIEMTAEYIPINEARRTWWGQFKTYEQAQMAYRPVQVTTDDYSDLPLFAQAAP